jgi:hypothetical protein
MLGQRTVAARGRSLVSPKRPEPARQLRCSSVERHWSFSGRALRPALLAFGLFLGATAGLGCAVAPAGTSTSPPDASPDEGRSTDRNLVTEAGAPEAPLDAARPDVATDLPADLSPPRPDGGVETGPPPPTWMGPPVIVGVGQGGRRIVSRDGNSWTGDMQDAKGNADPLKGFAAVAYGNGLVVAVGGGCSAPTTCAGRIATFNGDRWTEGMLPAGQSWLAGVAYGNGVWVAVGAAGPVLVSTDGKRWTQKTSVPANLRAVAFGSVGGTPMFVATGDRSVCWRSLDGMTWSNMIQLFPNDDPPVTLHAVVVGDGVVVAGGERGRRIRSLNGTSWDAAAGGGNDLPSVVYADHQFIAYADNSLAWISTNSAQTWDFITVVEAPTQAFATGALRDTRLFVGASGGTIKTSTDGRGWTRRLIGAADANAFTAFAFAGY